MKDKEPKMFTLYRGETPVKYLYGTNYWPLWIGDEGYDTPEEARAAWERKEHEWKNEA